MIGFGASAFQQRGVLYGQNLAALGFVVGLTLLFVYQLFVALAPATSLLVNSAVQAYLYSVVYFFFTILAAFVVSRADATVTEIAVGSCGIVFFGLGGIMLVRCAKTDWNRR